MSARVFISCGQSTAEERQATAQIRRWFLKRGFTPYVAIEAQSLADINSGIIRELKRADYYVFIDYRREHVVPRPDLAGDSSQQRYRGSLFTNQELAIAFLLGFENAIFLQQEGVEPEGLLRYMASNAQRFAALEEVPGLVEKLVIERQWDPEYSRHLALGTTHWTRPLRYADHTGVRTARVLQVDIHNRRSDLVAMGSIARLKQIVDPDGRTRTQVDRSPLKTTGQQGYAQPIWPESHAAWDLLAISMEQPATIYLNSSLDVAPRHPVISSPGDHLLEYEVFAEHFPALEFGVKLCVLARPEATSAELTYT